MGKISMINAKQLKAITEFAYKKHPKFSYVTVDFDKSTISVSNGYAAVVVKNVSGLDGKGKKNIPLDVVLSSVVLLGKNKFLTADEECFCGIPYASGAHELIEELDSIFETDFDSLRGCPGLYCSDQMKRLERLIAAFRGKYFFNLPANASKPLVLQILVDEEQEKPEGAEGWEPPTETVKAAIMPSAFSTMNTFVEAGASK